MRVLIIRPERESTALAAALAERGHVPVVAPLFQLELLHPPADFSASLAACQAVLLTSANGARALAEASDQRGRPILAVGDTTAATAEGLGFGTVRSASGDGAALAELVRQRLKPADGPLLHVTGREIAFDFAQALAPAGFEVRRFVLYDAREETRLPEPARAALEARALDVVTFFSPRAASVFASMVEDANLKATLRGVTAIAISPAALAPAAGLPFKATRAAARPTRQAVLDEIDRLAAEATAVIDAPPQEQDTEAHGTRGTATMSDEASPTPSSSVAPPAPIIHRGLGVAGAFVTGVVAAVFVVAGALIALPFMAGEGLHSEAIIWLILNGGVLIPVAMICLAIGPMFVPAPVVSMAFLIETVLAPIWVWLIFLETPTPQTLVGGAILITALLAHSLWQLHQGRRRRATQAIRHAP